MGLGEERPVLVHLDGYFGGIFGAFFGFSSIPRSGERQGPLSKYSTNLRPNSGNCQPHPPEGVCERLELPENLFNGPARVGSIHICAIRLMDLMRVAILRSRLPKQ